MLAIYIGPPLPPSNVRVQTTDFQTEKFTILLSWDGQEADNYTVNIISYSVLTTTVPSLHFEAEYNIPILITLRAVNCAGESEQVTVNVSVGKCIVTCSNHCLFTITLPSAGCSPPSPPVNGRVSEFTSSRVGAQVTYSCDTDLVLVGERVATCSEPSLQWLPSSVDIMCVPPPGIHDCVYAHCCQVLIYILCTHAVCGDPHNLPSHASISSVNGSVVTFSCDPGYSLHRSTTSQCVSGEWTPSPETVMCIAINQSEWNFSVHAYHHSIYVVDTPIAPNIPSSSSPYMSPTLISPSKNQICRCLSVIMQLHVAPSRDSDNSSMSNLLNTSEAVAITAVVCGLCSFTAGLVLGLLLSRYCTYCHRTGKRVATDRPPVYEDITPEKGAGIELQHNDAYGRVSL